MSTSIYVHITDAPTVRHDILTDGTRWVYIHAEDFSLHLPGENADAAAQARALAAALSGAADEIELAIAAQVLEPTRIASADASAGERAR